jgi:hypothetical protein
VESPLRPKEIQARIRAGETVEEIADAAGIAVERVRWFEGPVLAERAYVAEQAQSASVRRQGDAIPSSPGPRLGEIVAERMKVFGADPEDAQWDARKRGDGSWQVQLTFITGGRLHTADWIFDPRRRHVLPDDDNAARMSLPGPGNDGAPPQPTAPAPGEATVTQLAPRLGTASPFGPVAMSNGARHERPGPARPAAPEPRIPERATPGPREAEPPATAASVAPSAPPPGPAAPPSPPRVAAQAAPPGQAPPPARQAQPAQDVQAPAASPAEAPPAPPAAPAEAAPAEAAGEQAARQGRKAARGRRSSVPSWDEIMFGNSRGRD